MAKVSGYKCDLCSNLVTSEVWPSDWISVRLPDGNGGELRELCSNKCLLALAKGRMEGTKDEKNALREFAVSKGLKPQAIGAITRRHVGQRHEVNGPIEDCLICQFEMQR